MGHGVHHLLVLAEVLEQMALLELLELLQLQLALRVSDGTAIHKLIV